MSTAALLTLTEAPTASASSHTWRGILAVLGATIAMAIGFGALGLTAVFMGPLEQHFGWSRSDTSLAYGVSTIGMAVGGLFWGRLSDGMNMRVLLLVGGTGIVAALFSMATVSTLWQFYAASAALGGLGFSVLYAPLLAVSGAWFPRRRGLVTGVVTAGGALGQGVLPFAARILIDDVGWRLAYLSVGLAALMLLAITLPLVRQVDAGTLQPLMATDDGRERESSYSKRVALLSTAAFLCCACMGVPLVHLASFVGAVCGSPSIGATSLLVAMVFGAIGRICFGVLADRTGPLASYAIASLTQTVCVLLYPLLGDSLSLLGLSAVFGFGFAGNMTCLVLCVRDAVPAIRFGRAIGTVMLVAWAGMASGGYLGGWLFDMYLSYTLSFVMAGCAGAANLVLIMAIRALR